MNESKACQAVECFKSGFNCAQSVFSTYCEEFGLDRTTGLKLSCGLGAGMGRLQETCGAVSAAYLLISLKYGMTSADAKPDKEATYAMVRRFAELFTERNQTTNCYELLGVNLLTDDEDLVKEKHDSICPKVIQDSAEIIEHLLFA